MATPTAVRLLFLCGSLAGCKFASTPSVVQGNEVENASTDATLNDDSFSKDETTPVSTTATGTVPDSTEACDTLCTGVERDYRGNPGDEGALRWSACFSCRCKTALGQMPPAADLRCSQAQGPLTRWKAARGGGGAAVTGLEQIDPNGDEASKAGCLNRGIAAATCDLQSRWRRFVYDEGNLEYQLLCRKPTAASVGYYEYLIIGHNVRNGATCFWQARDDRFNGEDVPEIDLTGANNTPERLRAYAATFNTLTAGPSVCTDCHSNDAFIWSPYFHSVWPIGTAGNDDLVKRRIATDRKYFQVAANQAALQPVNGVDLTAEGQPLAQACGDCHRVTRGSYCSMARKAVGVNEFGLDEAGGFQYAKHLLYWMPPRNRQLSYFQGMRTLVENACR